MNKKAISFYIGLGLLFVPLILKGQNMDSILHVLDTCILQRSFYEERFIKRIDSLKKEAALCHDAHKSVQLMLKIAGEEFYHSSENALVAVEDGLRYTKLINDRENECKFLCIKSNIYCKLGFVREAQDVLLSVKDIQNYPPDIQCFYYESYYELYDFYRQVYYPVPDEISAMMLKNVDVVSDSLKKYIDNPARKALSFDYSAQNVQDMISVMTSYLDTIPNEDKALAALVLSNKYYLMRNTSMRDYYWALSAVYCIRYVRYRYEPLQFLAIRLFETGDYERANNYGLVAYDITTIWGSNVRKSVAAPTLAKGLKYERNRYGTLKSRMLYLTGAFSVVLLVMLFVIYKYYRRARMLQQQQEQLAHRFLENNDQLDSLKTTVELKNEYVTRFLELSLDAVFEIESFQRTVLMRLKSGDTGRLLKILEGDNQYKTFKTECLKRFDLSILRLYPNFTKSVNDLFLPDEKIVLSDTEILNNELRIVAFMKIGIDEGPRIATILGVSINTIYFYRNRLKNRAKNRDTFEADVASIE